MEKEIIELIIKLVIAFVFFLLSKYAIPWLKSNVGEGKIAEIQTFAEWAVRSAEQLYTEEQWQKKKEYAMQYVAEKTADIGLQLTIADIEALIESTVNYIKYGSEYTK